MKNEAGVVFWISSNLTFWGAVAAAVAVAVAAPLYCCCCGWNGSLRMLYPGSLAGRMFMSVSLDCRVAACAGFVLL